MAMGLRGVLYHHTCRLHAGDIRLRSPPEEGEEAGLGQGEDRRGKEQDVVAVYQALGNRARRARRPAVRGWILPAAAAFQLG